MDNDVVTDGYHSSAQRADEMRRKYEHLGRSRRPLTYDIAVEPEFEPWREWIDAQLSHLPLVAAVNLERRLWLDESHWPSIIELAAGAALRSAGYTIVYEQEWDGLTPDWTAVDTAGQPVLFVEAHTDQPPPQTYARIRGWHDLEQRIANIPVGVVLALKGNGRVRPRPPDGKTAKRIALDLKARLLASAHVTSVSTCGYTFVVLTDRYGFPLQAPRPLHAQLAPPSEIAGPVHASRLTQAVDEKVRKYAALADRFQVPLVAAVGAHRFTGVGIEEVDTLLTGEPVISFQYNVGDQFIGEQTVNLGHIPRWTMPAQLSGLLWLHNQPPFAATARPNPVAALPFPAVLAASTRC